MADKDIIHDLCVYIFAGGKQEDFFADRGISDEEWFRLYCDPVFEEKVKEAHRKAAIRKADVLHDIAEKAANGTATPEDNKRAHLIREHLRALGGFAKSDGTRKPDQGVTDVGAILKKRQKRSKSRDEERGQSDAPQEHAAEKASPPASGPH